MDLVVTKTKGAQKLKCIRINLEADRKAEKILSAANKKKLGRKIKLMEVMEFALGLVTDEHIKLLQDLSLTNEDRKELLRQGYISSRGQISRDEFTGFMMKPEFLEFLKEQKQLSD